MRVRKLLFLILLLALVFPPASNVRSEEKVNKLILFEGTTIKVNNLGDNYLILWKNENLSTSSKIDIGDSEGSYTIYTRKNVTKTGITINGSYYYVLLATKESNSRTFTIIEKYPVIKMKLEMELNDQTYELGCKLDLLVTLDGSNGVIKPSSSSTGILNCTIPEDIVNKSIELKEGEIGRRGDTKDLPKLKLDISYSSGKDFIIEEFSNNAYIILPYREVLKDSVKGKFKGESEIYTSPSISVVLTLPTDQSRILFYAKQNNRIVIMFLQKRTSPNSSESSLILEISPSDSPNINRFKKLEQVVNQKDPILVYTGFFEGKPITSIKSYNIYIKTTKNTDKTICNCIISANIDIKFQKSQNAPTETTSVNQIEKYYRDIRDNIKNLSVYLDKEGLPYKLDVVFSKYSAHALEESLEPKLKPEQESGSLGGSPTEESSLSCHARVWTPSTQPDTQYTLYTCEIRKTQDISSSRFILYIKLSTTNRRQIISIKLPRIDPEKLSSIITVLERRKKDGYIIVNGSINNYFNIPVKYQLETESNDCNIDLTEGSLASGENKYFQIKCPLKPSIKRINLIYKFSEPVEDPNDMYADINVDYQNFSIYSIDISDLIKQETGNVTQPAPTNKGTGKSGESETTVSTLKEKGTPLGFILVALAMVIVGLAAGILLTTKILTPQQQRPFTQSPIIMDRSSMAQGMIELPVPAIETIKGKRYAVLSHVGPRPNNEDAALALPSDEDGVIIAEGSPKGIKIENLKYDIYAVADGVGGQNKGEIASRIAVETLKEYIEYYGNKDQGYDPIGILTEAFEYANSRIIDYSMIHPKAQGMATTLTAVLVDRSTNTVYWAHAGDTRLYVVDPMGNITQITEDDSYVANLVKSGQITKEEAKVHPQRNIITKALGVYGKVNPSTGSFSLAPGSKLVLCTDGLHGVVEDSEIAKAVHESSIDAAVSSLVELALNRNTNDNTTLLVALI